MSDMVTFSLWRFSSMFLGSYLPTKTNFIPHIPARYGNPQPWTWKNGTRGIITSSEVIRAGLSAIPAARAMVCSTS